MLEIRPLVSAVASIVADSVSFSVAPTEIFDPIALFRRGEEGFYNDIQTYSTSYFTDTAGTDPAVLEDTIGLVLDQSQGLVLGPELVVNGTFDTDLSGWSVSAGNWTWSNGTALHNGSTFSTLQQNFGNRSGFKRLDFDYQHSSGAAAAEFNDSLGVTSPTSLTFSLGLTSGKRSFICPPGYDRIRFYRTSGAPAVFSIDNVSVKELPGNHLTQATAGARPKLSARYNLLERTEEFDNAYWTKGDVLAFGSGSIANAITAPDGELTADYIRAATNLQPHRVLRLGLNLTTGKELFYAKAKEYNYAFLSAGDSTNACGAIFTLSGAGAVFATNEVGGGLIVSTDIEFVGDGWYLCSLSYTGLSGLGTELAILGMYDGTESVSWVSASQPRFTGDGTSGIYIWGADLRLASDTDQPPYQRVTTATDYDSEGFDPYLQFDQVDDALVATIPAITGGTLVLATRQGIWIDDDINASAGTFSIGPTTYTGGPVGLFSNTGSKLIGPPLLIDRQLTTSELNAQIQFYKSRGAGDVFLVDFGLIFDRAGSSILDRNDDPIRVRAA
jgi:hypothetical protein